jgi:hypothetical protein
MAAPSNSIVYRDIVFTVGGTSYANQVSKARLVPDVPVQTYRTLVPDGVVQDIDSTVWTLELGGLQINHTGGLADALRDAAGTELACVLQPKTGSGQPTASFTIVSKMVPFGGEQGKYMEIDDEFPVVGAVTFGTSA